MEREKNESPTECVVCFAKIKPKRYFVISAKIINSMGQHMRRNHKQQNSRDAKIKPSKEEVLDARVELALIEKDTSTAGNYFKLNLQSR